MKRNTPLTIEELAARLGAEVSGNGNARIEGVAGLDEAGASRISFLADKRYEARLTSTRAAAVLVPLDWRGETPCPVIRVPDPEKAAERLASFFAPPCARAEPGVDPTAVIASDAVLGEEVHIGPCAVIGRGVRIGDRTVIDAHVTLAEGVEIGCDCRLYPQVSVREFCRIGHRVVLHNGVVIGSDGFGYHVEKAGDGTITVRKISQFGTVALADDVEIGANSTVDRARFGCTRIGRGVKIDNLVQVAHNVTIGDHSGIAAQTGISGSTHIGSGVMIWGQVGLAGHLRVGDGAEIGAQSGIAKDVAPGEFVVGTPGGSRRDFVRGLTLPRELDKLKKRLAAIESRLPDAGKRGRP